MIKMIIAPLLFSTLVVGIAGTGDLKAMGRIRLQTETRKCEIGAIGNKRASAGPASWPSVGPQFNEARLLQIWRMNSLFLSVVGVVGEGSGSAEFASKCRPDIGIGI